MGAPLGGGGLGFLGGGGEGFLGGGGEGFLGGGGLGFLGGGGEGFLGGGGEGFLGGGGGLQAQSRKGWGACMHGLAAADSRSLAASQLATASAGACHPPPNRLQAAAAAKGARQPGSCPSSPQSPPPTPAVSLVLTWRRR